MKGEREMELKNCKAEGDKAIVGLRFGIRISNYI